MKKRQESPLRFLPAWLSCAIRPFLAHPACRYLASTAGGVNGVASGCSELKWGFCMCLRLDACIALKLRLRHF